MISHSLAVGTRIHQAMELFYLLQGRGVYYLRQGPVTSDPSMTFKIETINRLAEVTVTDNANARGWKLPGNYHHRRGRR